MVDFYVRPTPKSTSIVVDYLLINLIHLKNLTPQRLPAYFLIIGFGVMPLTRDELFCHFLMAGSRLLAAQKSLRNAQGLVSLRDPSPIRIGGPTVLIYFSCDPSGTRTLGLLIKSQ
jgi:hypothetical protein